MTEIRWGVLGGAGIARKAMLPALQAARGCRVVALASRSPKRGAQMAQAFGIAQLHDSYEALLADPEIDAVYIPLPNHLHVPMTLKALEAGKHVLCEKPLAMTLGEARQVVLAARRAGRHVAEAFMTRHHPQWQRAKALIEAGAIGRLSAVQALFSYCNTDPENVRNQAAIGGGGLYDIGCYAIDTARFFFNEPPSMVTAAMDLDPVFGTDRLTTGAARFAGGGQLGFTVATQSALAQHLTLLGTDGFMTLEAAFNCPADHAPRLVLDDGRDLLGGGRQVELVPAADQYRLQAENFADHILTGAPAAAGYADILGNAAALQAMIRAGDAGSWEAVETFEEFTGS